ncbi:MAG: DinB family protein, partial [Cytophagales bacterium]
MIFDYRFYIIKQTRENFEKLIRSLTNEELNKIPKGFSNNIIWNFGHAIATQQLLTYGLSSLPLIVDEEFLNAFRKGSRPIKKYNEEGVKSILEISKITLESVERDFKRSEEH